MKKYFVKLTSRLLHSTFHQVMWYLWVFIVNPFSLLCSFFSEEYFLSLVCFLSPLPINNKSTFLSSQHFIWYIDWIFYFTFITKNANAKRILSLNFVNVSSSYWKLYAFKTKFFSKILINCCRYCWITIYGI